MPKARKIDQPASLDQTYVVPEDASITELSLMIEQARADGTKLVAEDSKAEGSSADRIALAGWYIGAIEAMQARQDEIAAGDQAEQAALAEVRARLGQPAAETDPESTDGDTDTDADTDGEPGVVQTGTALDPTGGVALSEPVLVASGASRRSGIADAAAAGASRAAVQAKRREARTAAYLTAGAGSGTVQAGATVDWDGIGLIGSSRFNALPKSAGAPTAQLAIGTVHIPTTDDRLVASASNGDYALADDAIEWACSMERVKAESGEDSLEAAGWCSPSDTLYDLIDLTTEDGLVDIPGFTVNRGGVRFSLGPDFATVYGSGQLFTQTEAQNIAGNSKPVANIPCPTFADHRMNVDGIYLTGDILSQKGYPEAYADFTRKSMTAFAHYVNAATIVDMVANSTLVDYVAASTKFSKAFTQDLLGTLEFQATDMRYKNRLSLTAPLEAVLPRWAIGALRSDLAKRLGVENGEAITDAVLNSYLALRGITAQWVYDWQDALTLSGTGFGGLVDGTHNILTWPTTIEFLIYPAGTHVRAQSDVIELSAVYDSTLLTTNQYVALFLERARLTLKRTWDARVVKIPVYVSGATAAGVDFSAAGYQPTV